ncbi:hypothetical protein IV77_GL000751 [Olsenella uli DSM 7084]|nr:hypothetical protein IV77_GL000751 [Olsenella uli DSM 7084]
MVAKHSPASSGRRRLSNTPDMLHAFGAVRDTGHAELRDASRARLRACPCVSPVCCRLRTLYGIGSTLCVFVCTMVRGQSSREIR